MCRGCEREYRGCCADFRCDCCQPLTVPVRVSSYIPPMFAAVAMPVKPMLSTPGPTSVGMLANVVRREDASNGAHLGMLLLTLIYVCWENRTKDGAEIPLQK